MPNDTPQPLPPYRRQRIALDVLRTRDGWRPARSYWTACIELRQRGLVEGTVVGPRWGPRAGTWGLTLTAEGRMYLTALTIYPDTPLPPIIRGRR